MINTANADQRALIDVSTRFMDQTCPIDVLRDRSWTSGGFQAGYRAQAGELGWYGLLVPEELGGGSLSGQGLVDAALIAYERGARLQPGAFIDTCIVAFSIARAGTASMRATLLPSLLSGAVPGVWAAATPTGSVGLADGVHAATTEGGYLLTGRRRLLPELDPQSLLLVPCTTPSGPIHVLLRADAPGLVLEKTDSLDLTRRFWDVHFDDVTVPDTAVLPVDAAESVRLLDDQLAIASVLVAADSAGAMNRDLAMTVQYAKDRIAFGRPIGSFQAVKHQLADAALQAESSTTITSAAARAFEFSEPGIPSPASMAKAFVSEAGIEVAQTCFQIFGAIGYTWEHDQHLYLRRLTTNAWLYGDATWHRERMCQQAGL